MVSLTKVKTLLLPVMLILAGQSSLLSQNSTGLSGTVVDSVEHVPIRNVYILVHRNGGIDTPVRTDQNGKYSVHLPVGLYDVFVSAEAFAPTCRKIEILPDGMTVFDASLRASDVGMQE